jgi:methionine-rich copper-binding protein CopC
MSISKIVTAISAAVILAPAAFGATTPAPSTAQGAAPAATAMPAAHCDSLQKQYQSAAVSNSSNPNAAKARKTATEGEKLCREGKSADGVKKLEHALKELGVKAQ